MRVINAIAKRLPEDKKGKHWPSKKGIRIKRGPMFQARKDFSF